MFNINGSTKIPPITNTWHVNRNRRLIREASGHIQVAMVIHNGNSMLGGPHINSSALKRMSALDLEINFDLYVGGRSFKD